MSSLATTRRPTVVTGHIERTPVAELTLTTYLLSGALALVAALAGLTTFFASNLLRGPAVMNGSARGTALVVFALAVPLLALAMFGASRGSTRAIILWLGAAAYILYNSLLFLFLTPANQLFLLYIAQLSLALWSIVAVVGHVDVGALRDRFSSRLPVRGIVVYTLAIVFLNALLWLRGIVPAIFSSGAPAFLNGTGVTTNIIYIQDLAVWLPLMGVAALWLYRRQAWGYLIVGSVLTTWVIESIGIAVDQWFGHNADPTSSVASAAFTPVFGLLALIGLVPLYFYYRNLDREDGRSSRGRS
jgi:hypothetical protein